MKKGIRISAINGVAKKAALGAMLASSVAMFASNPIKTARTDNPPQTEVVSKDGAEAVKAMTLPQQPKTAVPTVHNKKLDEKCLKFCDNDEEKKEMLEFLSDIYSQQGSYLGSATIQQNLDVNMFLKFLNGDIEILKKFEGEYRITDKSSALGTYYEVAKKYYTPENKAKIEDLNNKVGEWITENYFNIYADAFTFDNPPNYDELATSMDNFIENNTLEFAPGKPMFKYASGNLISKKNDVKNTQDKMNLIATDAHYMNDILFSNMMKLFYNPVGKDNSLYRLYDIYMRAVEPKIEQ